jgi:hypothetical protein
MKRSYGKSTNPKHNYSDEWDDSQNRKHKQITISGAALKFLPSVFILKIKKLWHHHFKICDVIQCKVLIRLCENKVCHMYSEIIMMSEIHILNLTILFMNHKTVYAVNFIYTIHHYIPPRK